MRGSDVFGRVILGAVGILLLAYPALAWWRGEALTPLALLAAVWMGFGAALALFAALTGSTVTTLPASIAAGTAWVPLVGETLRAYAPNGDLLAALDDPAAVEAAATIVMAAASVGVLLVVASIAMRRATPAT